LFLKILFLKGYIKKGKSAIVPPENMVGIVLTYNNNNIKEISKC